MSLPRLVATDLDGTLLRSDGTVSRRTADVLRGVLDLGVAVAYVTARPRRWVDHLWRYVGSRGLAVVSNGALLLDVTAGEPLEVRGIDPEPGLVLADAIHAAAPGTDLAVEMLAGIALEPGYREPEHAPPDAPVGPLAEVWTAPALKLLARHETMAPASFRAAVADAVGDLATPTWTMDGLVEISAAGVTKGSGLSRLCERLGIGAGEVLAFGDMPNDIPMLTWAGTSYAMGNAHPDVTAAAGARAPRNDEDGVAAVVGALWGL